MRVGDSLWMLIRELNYCWLLVGIALAELNLLELRELLENWRLMIEA